MDLADRYVNSECVKRMLQADQVALAEKTAVLFTKDGDQHNNLHDMQCMWYELASGESYFHQGDLGRALKKFLAVEKHYADITEDQFDFHSYCLRKMTLRTYVEMLKFQDRLHSHVYFEKAAAGAIRNGALGPIREWTLKDCIAVHKLLGAVLLDQDAASRWKSRCAEYFPYSTYFEGSRSSVSPNSVYSQLSKNSENESSNHSTGSQNAGSIKSNGKLDAFKDLTI
ncbi:N-alpha-acetyltransferase 16, NatA auxiliary subunit [Stylosanthes scabra]|uniref:N-alpha-acetyltransferase 16, NatA auxiliary subunit n=1 Tax=Stylosanthes scabra TaxID=79078 RepID=A0ABU6V0J7_9FABA|nr:N-alpha-acetyltransferase 16, NatA auxiliary subunit [Stylosanthes scabra]